MSLNKLRKQIDSIDKKITGPAQCARQSDIECGKIKRKERLKRLFSGKRKTGPGWVDPHEQRPFKQGCLQCYLQRNNVQQSFFREALKSIVPSALKPVFRI